VKEKESKEEKEERFFENAEARKRGTGPTLLLVAEEGGGLVIPKRISTEDKEIFPDEVPVQKKGRGGGRTRSAQQDVKG